MTESCKTCGNSKKKATIPDNLQPSAQKEDTSAICRNCGKASPSNRRAGSFSSYLFKELRCQCITPARKRTSASARTERRKSYNESFKGNDLTLVSSSTVFPRGTLIGGTFIIISTIGEGGMGHVYLVDHAVLNRRFALKVLSPQLVNEENWLRFQSEAKTLAALNHAIFVKVYDLGIHEHSVPYYSMDFISGRSLEEILEVLSGSVPFEGSNSFETLILHQEGAPPLLSEVAPQLDLSPSLDLVLSKSLAKRPQDLYQSAKELAIDLTRIRENKEILTFQRPTHKLTNSAALNSGNGSRLKKIAKSRLAIACLLLITLGAASQTLF